MSHFQLKHKKKQDCTQTLLQHYLICMQVALFLFLQVQFHFCCITEVTESEITQKTHFPWYFQRNNGKSACKKIKTMSQGGYLWNKPSRRPWGAWLQSTDTSASLLLLPPDCHQRPGDTSHYSTIYQILFSMEQN